ncbi:MAG: hypothetical protein AB1432_07615 [Bacteroidota bacterium]|jgi:hypothetical protein
MLRKPVNKSKPIIVTLASYFLCFSFIAFLITVSLTSHYHILPDGRIVAHSHFVNQASSENNKSNNNHTHTEKEFSLYQQISKISEVITHPYEMKFLDVSEINVLNSNSCTIVYRFPKESHWANAPPFSLV